MNYTVTVSTESHVDQRGSTDVADHCDNLSIVYKNAGLYYNSNIVKRHTLYGCDKSPHNNYDNIAV